MTTRPEPSPRFFATPAAFRTWLAKNHTKASELVVGYYKKETGKPSLTWSESVDVALCFGWIDGVRRKHSEDAYTIRFTPRRSGSNWSAINIRKMARLESDGLMTNAGRTAFENLKKGKARVYSYEQRKTAAFDKSQLSPFKRTREAWKFFEAQAPSYRQAVTHWVMSAKKEETRTARLNKLVAACLAGKRLI